MSLGCGNVYYQCSSIITFTIIFIVIRIYLLILGLIFLQNRCFNYGYRIYMRMIIIFEAVVIWCFQHLFVRFLLPCDMINVVG